MNTTINVKQLRASLPSVVARVRKGARYTVLYRSRPVFQIVPIDESTVAQGPLEDEPLYEAGPVGRSTDGSTAADHDRAIYGR